MSQSTAVQLSYDSNAAYRRGDYAAAEQLALQALRVDKKNADSLLILGNIFYLRRNYEKALEWYRKMQKVAPGDVSLKINIANTFHAMRNYAEARRYAQEVLKTDSQNVSALTALAYAFFEEDDYADSIPVFQQALQLDSSDFWLHNYLGQAYQKSGDHLRGIEHAWQAVTLSGGADSQHINFAYTLYEAAIEKGEKYIDDALQKWLDAYSENAVVKYVVDSLRHSPKVTKADSAYVQNIFDVFADTFEDSLAALNYSVPQLIRSAAAKIYGTDSEAALNVLDAGCGTGLCAKLLSEILPHATFFGVDLSVRMIMEARKKNIYKQLFVDDLEHFSAVAETPYDMIVAADVLTYFGELQNVFDSFFRILAPGGNFIFSVTRNVFDSQDYYLHLSGRFAHAENYVKSCAEKSGFVLANQSGAKLRNEGEAEVMGWIFTLRKP